MGGGAASKFVEGQEYEFQVSIPALELTRKRRFRIRNPVLGVTLLFELRHRPSTKQLWLSSVEGIMEIDNSCILIRNRNDEKEQHTMKLHHGTDPLTDGSMPDKSFYYLKYVDWVAFVTRHSDANKNLTFLCKWSAIDPLTASVQKALNALPAQISILAG